MFTDMLCPRYGVKAILDELGPGQLDPGVARAAKNIFYDLVKACPITFQFSKF